MTSNNRFYVYLESQKEPYEVSREVYVNYYHDVWTTQKRMRRHNTCFCPKSQIHKCLGDCNMCPHYLSPDFSLDDEAIMLENILADSYLSEANIILHMDVNKALAQLTELQLGVAMTKMYDFSERYAAELLGLSKSTYHRTWVKVRDILAVLLADYATGG